MHRHDAPRPRRGGGPVSLPPELQGLFWNAVEAAPLGVLLVDPSGAIVLANHTAESIFGYKSDGLKGVLVDDLLRPQDRRNHERVRAVYNGSPQPRHMVGRTLAARHRAGKDLFVEVGLSHVSGPGGTYVLASVNDVSRSVRDAEALRRSEEAYRLLLDQAPDAIVISDSAGQVIDANQQARGLTGFSLEELRSRLVVDLFVPEQAEQVARDFESSRKDAHTQAERLLLRKGGPPVPVEVSARALSDGRVQAILRDITERREAERQVRARERQLEAVVQAISDIVFELDDEGRYLSIWCADDSKLAAPRDEVLGSTIIDVLGEEAGLPFIERIQRVLETGTPETMEYSLNVEAGERFFSARIHRLTRTPDGRETVCMGIADITERRTAELALRANEARLRTLFETVELAVLGLDAYGRVDYVNPFLNRLLGYEPGEVLGLDWIGQCVPPAMREEVRAAFGELIRQGGGLPHFENPILTRWGEERLVSWHNIVVKDSQGKITGTLSVGEDVTERHQLEEQFLQAQKMEAVGQLAGGVAHDFNNILTAILGHVDILQEGTPAGDPAVEDLAELRNAAERAAELTRQLLAFSRKQVRQPRVVDLSELVAQAERMLRRLIGEDIAMVTELEPERGYVQADPGQLEQVLLNLVVNARDAMPDGGRLFLRTGRTTVRTARAVSTGELEPGSYLTLSVKDTGVGMEPSVQGKLFEPFFTTKEVGKGTGLGLATVYGIASQSGGEIEVTSEPGGGSEFVVYLPEVGPPDTGEKPTPDRSQERGAETVLLVEDDEAVRTVAVTGLMNAGHRVLVARDDREALRKLADDPSIRLLITDVMLPGMSGLELARAARAMRPDVRLLFSSGFRSGSLTLDDALESGAAFLAKPYTLDGLRTAVREVLDAPPAPLPET